MSSHLIKQLHENRLRTWNEAKALADRVDAEKRSFSGEEERQWLRLMQDIDTYDERITQIQTQERSAQNAAAVLDVGSGAGGFIRNEELRAWAKGDGNRAFEVRHPGQAVDFRTLSGLTAGAQAGRLFRAVSITGSWDS